MDRATERGNQRVFTRKIMVYIVLAIVLLLACPLGGLKLSANAEAKSSTIVMEAESGRVLEAKNAQIKLPLASTTKILTAITVIENTDTAASVKIPKQAEGVEGSSIYLKANENWKIKDLLFGLMLRSGNDAAVALAYATSGSIEEFCCLMNRTAINAGAFNSHFVNPHGLDDEAHYTTAFDLAMITRYALRSELFRQIVGSKKHDYLDPSGKPSAFFNKNKMLKLFDGANGVKTGFTKQSGRCLVTSAIRENMQLITVVLNVSNMWQASAVLLKMCYSKYDMVTLAEKDKVITNAKLRYNKGEVGVCVKRSLRYPLSEVEKENIRYEFSTINNRINAEKDIYMGKVDIYHKNYLLFSEKLYSI